MTDRPHFSEKAPRPNSLSAFHSALGLFLVVALSITLAGCFGSSGKSRSERSGAAAAEVEFPDGDPSVSAADGGPGFTGEGWTTVDSGPLGDPTAVKGGTIRSFTSSWPDNLRFYGVRANTSFNYLLRDLCFDALCKINRQNLDLVPSLASHWKISDDKMTFTFRINPKAHWSDGKPVTSADVIATYRLIADETLIDPMNRAEIVVRMNEPVAKSKYIVEVTCKQLDWRNFANFAILAILPAHEIGGITGTEFLDKFNFHFPVVSGAYKLPDEDIKTDKSITLTRRPDYWAVNEPRNAGLYNFDKIRFDVVLDLQKALQMTSKGDLDYQVVNVAKWWVEDLPKEEAVQKNWLIRRKVFTKYPKDVQGFAINMRHPPLDDVRVRRALFHLFDRKTMVEKFAYNEYALLKSHHPGDDGENPDNPLIEFDPRQASELLDEAGWKERGPDGIRVKDGKRLSVNMTYSLPVMEKYLTNWQQAAKQAGVEIKLQLLDHETQYANNQDRKFEISTQNWAFSLFSSPRPMFHSSMADEKGADNFAGVRDPQIDEWIDLYDAEFDRDKRNELMRKIDGKVYSLTPYILNWGAASERIIYWNKFGMPATVLPRFGRYDDVYSTWWIDPSKEQTLKAARQNGTPLEPIPIEIRPWDDKKTAAAAPAVSQGSFPWVR